MSMVHWCNDFDKERPGISSCLRSERSNDHLSHRTAYVLHIYKSLYRVSCIWLDAGHCINLAYSPFLFFGSLTLTTTAVVKDNEFKCRVKTPCAYKVGLRRIFEVKKYFWESLWILKCSSSVMFDTFFNLSVASSFTWLRIKYVELIVM